MINFRPTSRIFFHLLAIMCSMFSGGAYTVFGETMADHRLAHRHALLQIDNAHKENYRVLIGHFLPHLQALETKMAAEGNLDGVLACRQLRVRCTGTEELIPAAEEVPAAVAELEGRLRAQITVLVEKRDELIRAARSEYWRKLRGLANMYQQNEQENEWQAVLAEMTALEKLARAAAPAAPLLDDANKEPQLVWMVDRLKGLRRWRSRPLDALKPVVADGVTTITYTKGERPFTKAAWDLRLLKGTRISFEMRGGRTVEVMDASGLDMVAYVPVDDRGDSAKVFQKYSLLIEEDRVRIAVNDVERQVLYYSADGGDLVTVRGKLIESALQVGFSFNKGTSVSIRNFKISHR